MNHIIFHIDVNSAYLSWTALQLLKEGEAVDLRSIPSIIGGDMDKRLGVVLAKSIPAKKYGIKTGEPIVNALRKCPNLTLKPPEHLLYHEKSHELMEFLYNICPDIEQVSVDECYMDYTPVRNRFSSPDTAAAYIKNQIREFFGYTVNIGISDKKVLAKMASDFEKPDMIHTLYTDEIKDKMWPLPVTSLFMCGHSSVNTLQKLGINTIGELASANREVLSSHLKSHGLLLWEYANGIDSSAVAVIHAEIKGIGNSTTLPKDAVTAEEARKPLLSLSESVAARLRSSSQLAGMISVEIKYSNFQSVSHQTSLLRSSCTTQIIFETAWQLFEEIWNGSPIRLLGIRTAKLTANTEPIQLSLFDFSCESNEILPSASKFDALDKTLDDIRKKYGDNAIVRGSLLTSDSLKEK